MGLVKLLHLCAESLVAVVVVVCLFVAVIAVVATVSLKSLVSWALWVLPVNRMWSTTLLVVAWPLDLIRTSNKLLLVSGTVWFEMIGQ